VPGFLRETAFQRGKTLPNRAQNGPFFHSCGHIPRG
jgi:hypothetical protein